MDSGETDRGISELAGAVLVFAAIIITLSLYQATVVPIQNERVEFDHNVRVQGDMQELRQAILNIPNTGGSEAVILELGVRYPARALLINPAPATGTLTTDGVSTTAPNLSISNAVATGEVGDFWNGTARNYSTGAVVYRPNYNEYTDAPTTYYENSVLYNRFNETVIPLTSQTIVDGRRITLTAIGGSVSRDAIGEASIDVQAISPERRTVTVTDSGANLTVSIPTRLSLATWEDLLADEFVENGSDGHITRLSMSRVADSEFDRLTIEFEPGVTYELRLAKVTIGDETEAADIGYVSIASGNLTTITTAEQGRLVAEVRNRFNNPMSGVEVTFITDNGTFSNGNDTTVITSDAKGQAEAILSASNPGEATVTAGIDDNNDGSLADEPDTRTVTFTVFIRSS